jgi:hypothetical protein
MIMRTVTNDLAITSPIAMKITMTGAKISRVTTISILPPDEAIDVSIDGSIENIMIFTMTSLIPTMAVLMVGGTEAGTGESIVIRNGMLNSPGVIEAGTGESIVVRSGMLNSPGVVVRRMGTNRDSLTTVVALGLRNDPSSQGACVASVSKE